MTQPTTLITDSTPEPEEKPQYNPPDEFAAIIFDMELKVPKGGMFSAFFGGKNDSPPPNSINLAGPIIVGTNGLPEVDKARDIQLIYGVNFNISLDRWEQLVSNPPEILKEYLKGDCFELFKPKKKGLANSYSLFDERNAIRLVQATMRLDFLDDYGATETRESVRLEINEQANKIKALKAASQQKQPVE
jgi:hypothetical protein